MYKSFGAPYDLVDLSQTEMPTWPLYAADGTPQYNAIVLSDLVLNVNLGAQVHAWL